MYASACRSLCDPSRAVSDEGGSVCANPRATLLTICRRRLIIVLTKPARGTRNMAYYIPDHISAHDRGDGGLRMTEWRGSRVYRSWEVEPDGCVTISEASRIIQPPVSRVAVFKWIKAKKLKALMVEGEYLITLTDLRRFAAKNGKGWPTSSRS